MLNTRPTPCVHTGTIAACLHQAAFWGWSKAVCEDWAGFWNLDTSGASNLMELLMLMVKHCLDPCTDARACEILGQRMANNDLSRTFTSALMEVEEAYQVLDQHDHKEMWDRQKQAQEEAKAFEQFREDWAQTRRRHPGEHGGHAAAGKGRGRGRGGKGRGGRGGRGGPPPLVLPSTIPQADAKRYIPPNSSIWRGLVNSTWNAHVPPLPRISESWKKGGEQAALVRILIRMWRHSNTLQGNDIHFCPVHGLMELAEESGDES